MAKNRYYYYDQEACAFVEVQPTRTKTYVQFSAFVVGVLLLAGAFTWSLDRLTTTPEELALQAENEALQEQLAHTEERIVSFSEKLDELSAADQDLYRVLLQADPISEDVRQAGVGGADPYESFNRFSASTSKIMRETTRKLDQLERQLSLQNTSYRELADMATEHEAWLVQMPAILPANGNVISSFGMRRHPILKITRMHSGVDIVTTVGTPVYATGNGVVREAGRNGGYGLNVVIEHPQAGYLTRYAHLSEIPKHIKPGREVKRGEHIALSGNTGLSAGPHVHYEVMDLDGRALNPISFFAPSLTPRQYKSLLEASNHFSMALD